MSTYQCPKCELRFSWKTELDDHCWHDHPQFRHEYPAHEAPPETIDPPAAEPRERAAAARERARLVDSLGGWLTPKHPHG